MQCVVLGHPDNRRVHLFQAALARRGQAPARVLPWNDWLDGKTALSQALAGGELLRIESPELDERTERALLERGAACGAGGHAAIAPAELRRRAFTAGEIRWPRQWYLGWRAALGELARQRRAVPPHWVMNAPEEIAALYDKAACHARFAAAGVPAAPLLGTPRGAEELRALMLGQQRPRVFVKLAHGSSAFGACAVHWPLRGGRALAMSTVRFDAAGSMFSSLRPQLYRGEAEVRRLLDAVCPHAVVAEAWLPKFELGGRGLDLRVLVIRGRAAHVVGRSSATPFTNLNLGNSRIAAEALRQQLPPATWDGLLDAVQRAAACFPGAGYCGVDVLVRRNRRDVAVLEANAFGDLLPGLHWQGRDSYEAELEALAC